MAESGVATEVRRILDAGDLGTVFQPIVDLESRSPVAYEALSRGPKGSPAEMPDVLFPAAAAIGLTEVLDRACVKASLSAARTAGLLSPFSLFMNVEARTLEHVGDLLPLDVVVVIEITERDLLEDLGGLVRAVARLRAGGLRIAMDDVGSDPRLLALLPLLRPDIIKLDMSLLQLDPDQNTAQVINALSNYREHFDALVIAEGIETEEHAATARAFGATLGQGWLFGRPLPEIPAPSPPGVQFSADGHADVIPLTPFAAVEQKAQVNPAARPLLVEISRFMELSALQSHRSALMFSTFQNSANFTPLMVSRYTELASKLSLVAVFVHSADPDRLDLSTNARLQINTFETSDPLAAEWSVIVLSADYAAMMTAREHGADGHRGPGYEFVLTHSRELVTAAALSLATRLIRPDDRTG